MSAYDPEKRAEIVRLFKAGLTYAQIGRKVGIGRSAVGGHLARWRSDVYVMEAELARNEMAVTRNQPCRIVDGAENARQIADDKRFVRALALAFQRGDHLPVTKNSDLPQRGETIPRREEGRSIHRDGTGVISFP